MTTNVFYRLGYMAAAPVKVELYPTLNTSHDTSLNDSRVSLTGYSSSPATTPSGRDNKAGWYDMHQKHVALAARPLFEIILCGDSIIAGLSRYAPVWRKYFEPLKALNFGIGGDRTQHVLWRAENMNITSSVKFVVLHFGTNNIDRDSPDCIANGILSVALTFKEKVSDLKVIVTGLLPRDYEASSIRRSRIKKVNHILKKMCRDELTGVYFMKQDTDWTSDDGNLNRELYYNDYLHLVEKGNEKFASSISKAIKKVKEDGKLDYSDDEGGTEESDEEQGISVSHYTYKRARSEKRKRHYDDEDDYERRHAKRSRKSRDRHSHRSHSSKSKSKRRRRSDDSETSPVRHKEKDEKSSWDIVRKISSMKKKKKGKGKEKDDSDHDVSSGEDDNSEHSKDDSKLRGVAKSIDISLDEQKRLEARRNKFGISEAASSVKNSLLATMESGKRAAQKLLANRNKHSIPASTTTPTKNSDAELLKIKKFYSDFNSGSDTE